MTERKEIGLDFYCENDEACKSEFCIRGEDVCPYLRATKRVNQIEEKEDLRELRRDNIERTLREMKG